MYRVLIIDDEPWSRMVVKELGQWEELGLEIAGEAEDGCQGLGLMEELRPDIVITDMRMPGVEGVELLRQMKEMFPQIKIIVMSGYDDFVYLKQAIRSRVIEYLLKPVDPEELNNALKQCLQEIESKGNEAGGLGKTGMVFKDPASLETYLSLRQQILWHMLEINKPAVMSIFEKVSAFLGKVFSDQWNEGLQNEIAQDFMLMLKELVSENEAGFEDYPVNTDLIKKPGVRSIEEVVSDIASLYREYINATEAFRKSKNRVDIKEIQQYIDKNFNEPISLDTISQAFFVSREHLSRVFKASTGENLSDYILRRRMEKARELIVKQKMAIKHAAEMVGYTDLAYFYRVFKKHYGITPGELRRE